MLIAFIAVVSVQWIWMKYSMREGEARFTSKVYEVLGKAVNLVEQTNNIRLFNDLKERYTQVEEVISTMNHAQDSVLTDEDPGNNEISLFSLAFSKGKVGEGQGGNISSMLRIFMNPGGRMGPGYILETDRDNNILYQVMRSATSEAERLADSLERQRMMDLVREFVIRYLREKDPQMAQVEKRLENVDLNPYLKEEMINTGIDNPFTWKIMTREQIVQYIKEKGTKGFYYVELFPNDQPTKDANLCVMFDTKDSLFYNNMGWMFIASGFCIIGLMSVFIITIVIIMRQQKLSVIKNDFINNMTHEFKTPLATISLATSAIEKEKVLNDRTQILKFNSMIRNENERMNKYVERILLQAKLDRREVHLKKVPVNLNVLVDEAVEHFRLQVEEKGGVIRAELDPEGYVISADEVHMLNVVCNLIDNAIKYSHDSLNIYIYTKQEGNRFIIGVRDTGIGIPKEAQDKVFKRFYRVPSGNVHNVKGFGLGLSYAKSIVELHGGEIQLTSKKNKGTQVEIIFKMES